MSTLARLLGLLCIFLLASLAPVRANDFPQKPVNIVVPWGPGGPTDITVRALIEETSARLKQPLVVLNRPGASGTIGTAEVFRANADGYTILLADNISTVFQPQRMKLPYRGAEDFQAVIKITEIPNVLVVQADAKWKTLDELVADARARPGQIRVATAGRFTGTDLNVIEFNQVAGIDLANVPSTGGTAQAVALLLGGHVEAAVAAPGSVGSQVAAKKLRPLAVFSKRTDLFPDVPSTPELGYKTTMTSMFYISAPKNIDAGALGKLQESLRGAMQTEKFKAFAQRYGLQIDPLGPKELTVELAQWQEYFVKLSRELRLSEAK